jgi:NADPH-dependent 2,4-dienoyl-CoA reductase/sulfur reductase-like enzyme
VVTDQRGATAVPGVVAVGDCATVRDPVTGLVTRDEHWTAAATRPAVAIKVLLSGGTSTDVFTGVPYVWSDQYQQRIQFAGEQGPDCSVDIVEGDAASGPFVAVYRRAGDPVAVLALSSPRPFGKWRRQVQTNPPCRAKDAESAPNLSSRSPVHASPHDQ